VGPVSPVNDPVLVRAEAGVPGRVMPVARPVLGLNFRQKKPGKRGSQNSYNFRSGFLALGKADTGKPAGRGVPAPSHPGPAHTDVFAGYHAIP